MDDYHIHVVIRIMPALAIVFLTLKQTLESNQEKVFECFPFLDNFFVCRNLIFLFLRLIIVRYGYPIFDDEMITQLTCGDNQMTLLMCMSLINREKTVA
jgi:hypothetical protein